MQNNRYHIRLLHRPAAEVDNFTADPRGGAAHSGVPLAGVCSNEIAWSVVQWGRKEREPLLNRPEEWLSCVGLDVLRGRAPCRPSHPIRA